MACSGLDLGWKPVFGKDHALKVQEASIALGQRPRTGCHPAARDYSARTFVARSFRARPLCGGMAEWLKAHAWKACIRETVSWVRIPLPPSYNIEIVGIFCHFWSKRPVEPRQPPRNRKYEAPGGSGWSTPRSTAPARKTRL